jgi:hypothetical protein
MTADWNVHGVDIINLTPCEGKREEGVRNTKWSLELYRCSFLGGRDLEFQKFKNQPYGTIRLVCGCIPSNI